MQVCQPTSEAAGHPLLVGWLEAAMPQTTSRGLEGKRLYSFGSNKKSAGLADESRILRRPEQVSIFESRESATVARRLVATLMGMDSH